MPCRDLEELIREIPSGVTLVGESTFESFDSAKRRLVIELAASREINFLTVPTRGNPQRRAAYGLPKKERQDKNTDLEDAQAIQHAARNGAHLKRPAAPDPEWCQLQEKAARRLMWLRSSREKDAYALEEMRHVWRQHPYPRQPDERRIALGKGGNYNPIIVAAVAVAAEFVSTRSGFDRLTGLYAHGYPSQFRSDLMFWGWGRQPRKRERISLSVYRRELRWLFHQLKGRGQ